MFFVLLVFAVLGYHFYTDLSAVFAMLFLSPAKRTRRIEQVSVTTANFLFTCGRRFFNLELIYEANNIDIPPQSVIVSNHQSLLDIYICLSIFSQQHLRFVAKKELTKNIPGVSRVLRYLRHGLISRSSQLRETNALLKAFARRCERERFSPCIFPEGTRSRDGVLRDFNAGAYRILQSRLMLPTLVLAVDGGWKFSHFADFFHRNEYVYRVKLLAHLPAPRNKQDMLTGLEKAHGLIGEQLDQWRTGESKHAQRI